MRVRPIAWSVALVFAFSGAAQATVFDYFITLDGTQAGTGSPATGAASIVLDDVGLTLSIDLTYSGLQTPNTNAHIHCCAPPGTNAGVVIPFVPAGFVTGTTSGSFSALFTNLAPATLASIEAGLAYVNIHTTGFPGGEIRGQIPEPATLALLAAGIAGLAAFRRPR